MMYRVHSNYCRISIERAAYEVRQLLLALAGGPQQLAEQYGRREGERQQVDDDHHEAVERVPEAQGLGFRGPKPLKAMRSGPRASKTWRKRGKNARKAKTLSCISAQEPTSRAAETT